MTIVARRARDAEKTSGNREEISGLENAGWKYREITAVEK